MKILIVEDELQLALSIKEYLSDEDYSCEIAHTYSEAIDKLISFHYDCILIDIMLPDGSGMKLVQELNAMQREDGVLIILGKITIGLAFEFAEFENGPALGGKQLDDPHQFLVGTDL